MQVLLKFVTTQAAGEVTKFALTHFFYTGLVAATAGSFMLLSFAQVGFQILPLLGLHLPAHLCGMLPARMQSMRGGSKPLALHATDLQALLPRLVSCLPRRLHMSIAVMEPVQCPRFYMHCMHFWCPHSRHHALAKATRHISQRFSSPSAAPASGNPSGQGRAPAHR